VTGALLVRGGHVVDGTGGPGWRGDVAVRDGRVVAVGERIDGALDGAGPVTELDASGCVVTPGFIDLHTHYDAQLLWDPTCSSSCWQGVTTVVVGNCGFSLAPVAERHRDLVVGMLHDLEDMSPDTLRAGITWDFESLPEYLDAVARRRPTLNVAAYVGHSAVRVDVLGAEAFERAATPDEIDRMRALVDDGMRAGAVGFATSASPTGRNCPSKHASPEETGALVGVLAEHGRGLASFVPGGAFGHEALYELQPRIGRPFTWTALLTTPDGRHDELAAIHRAGRARGADVHPQVSCRPLVASTDLASPFALRCPAIRELDRATPAERRAAYADPGWRDRARVELAGSLLPPRWDRWTLAVSSTAPDAVGSTVAAVATARGVDPFDLVLDLSLAEDLATRFTVAMANDDEPAVADLLRLEGAVLGLSDAGAHPDQLCDAVLPLDLLGGWVRERGVLGLEAAVHKLTGELARLLGFADRGVVRPGAVADLVVLDPSTVGPGPLRRARDLPAGGERLLADAPTGLRHVLVAGTPIHRDGASLVGDLDPRPGHVLRPGRAA
jgi:N-acyl-D-aspartate/D-glutamate deacylase